VNENDAYIFDVEEPTSWAFAGEATWISGWFISKVGAVFTDIRAVIDGVPFLGIIGLPREEPERRHRGHVGLPHAGFALRVLPPRGAKLLRLELLDAGGRWVEIWRTGIKVRRGPNPGNRLRHGTIPDQLRKLLQARRADPGADLSPLARRLAIESASVPLDTLPVPPFFGALENPLLTGGSQYGKLKVEGWIIHQEQRIHRLFASTHPLVENDLDYGDRVRAEAAALFPGHPYAGRSQFFGMVDIDDTAGDPACLRIFAELEDGTRHLVFARRFYQRACTQMERPLPAFSQALFLDITRTFLAACRAEGVRMSRWRDIWAGCREAHRLYRRFAPADLAHRAVAQAAPYADWQRAHAVTPNLELVLRQSAQSLTPAGPPITLIVDARRCTHEELADLAASLQRQYYPSWEAWFVGAPAPAGDTRFKQENLVDPADFVRALNAAAHQARGQYLALLPGHSRLAPDALVECAERCAATPAPQLVYTDEDAMDDAGRRSSPTFKPRWSAAFADSGLFPGQLCLVRQDRFVALGSFREAFSLVPWYDLLLRLGDHLPADQAVHIPLVLHHRRAGRTEEIDPADPSVEQARRALLEAARRRGLDAAPFLPEVAHHRRLRFHQLRWGQSVLKRWQVTIVIPTRDRLHLLQECVELLDETVDWRYVKLIIVDDHSRDADAVRYLDAIQRRNDLMCQVLRPKDHRAPFNYSHLVNLALPHLDTPLVLHLNNDVNALERGWLEEMAGWFSLPDVGVVGAQLVYPDKTLNHTGIVIGPHDGLADTPLAKAEPSAAGVSWHAAAREVSAVTGACLMTRTEIYRQLGGFDEQDFGVAYNDVDYCLRVCALGQRVIYTPQARLMHWGSATRGVTFDEGEHIAFVRRYAGYADPYFSRHLQLVAGRPECRGGGSTRTSRVGRLRLLLLTHNLNYEGAPLFLLEYATHLARVHGFGLEVLTMQDGPLRAPLSALGARITVADAAALYASPDEEVFQSRLADIAHSLEWDGIDLVVCNTLVCFWGVHLARFAGKPSLFYIHESTSLFRFFEQKLELALHHLVAEALGQATRTLFLCAATRAYYEDCNVRGNFRIVPSWIDLDAIERFRREKPRAALRRQLGFGDDETVIVNIGTVCERKGQHIFIRAVDHFNHHFGHRGKFRFVMVGARPGIYLDLLNRDLARLGLANVNLVPETGAVFDYFAAADLFVCTSFEESFPRVVMEAMAFRTPIVSTDVHGIPDLIGQRQDGYLVPPGDHMALSRMIWSCLAKERSGKTLTATAYSKVLRRHDATRVLPRHADLAREAFLAG